MATAIATIVLCMGADATPIARAASGVAFVIAGDAPCMVPAVVSPPRCIVSFSDIAMTCLLVVLGIAMSQ
eukprot:1191230-Alexandrium_andersonii.AAC.1